MASTNKVAHVCISNLLACSPTNSSIEFNWSPKGPRDKAHICHPKKKTGLRTHPFRNSRHMHGHRSPHSAYHVSGPNVSRYASPNLAPHPWDSNIRLSPIYGQFPKIVGFSPSILGETPLFSETSISWCQNWMNHFFVGSSRIEAKSLKQVPAPR